MDTKIKKLLEVDSAIDFFCSEVISVGQKLALQIDTLDLNKIGPKISGNLIEVVLALAAGVSSLQVAHETLRNTVEKLKDVNFDTDDPEKDLLWEQMARELRGE